jgi:hypothetical protein
MGKKLSLGLPSLQCRCKENTHHLIRASPLRCQQQLKAPHNHAILCLLTFHLLNLIRHRKCCHLLRVQLNKVHSHKALLKHKALKFSK